MRHCKRDACARGAALSLASLCQYALCAATLRSRVQVTVACKVAVTQTRVPMRSEPLRAERAAEVGSDSAARVAKRRNPPPIGLQGTAPTRRLAMPATVRKSSLRARTASNTLPLIATGRGGAGGGRG